ncbi:PLP-dependent transferase [Pseudomonas sp. TH41]|uniref:PLP-dependent transferase n=1 Tax=Pseudomonas sp. TH41 TaxID=2796405 RepID=UPI0019140390|nr:PLP-dependent transferase [Pseudomonas sp. TH41]MBK5353009.1 PLP-dependent transferase [Pseudomonas sp. TH41]
MSKRNTNSRGNHQPSAQLVVKGTLSVLEHFSCEMTNQANKPGCGKVVASNNNMWSELLHQLMGKFKHLITVTKQHRKSALIEGLPVEQDSVDYVLDRLISSVTQLKKMTTRKLSHTSARHAYRLMIQEYSFLRNSLTWCSASNDQSRCVMFFDQGENNSTAVNYDRYGSSQLREAESNLLLSLGFNTEKSDLLLASSGQAAYTIIESFLLGSVVQEGTRVVTSPYIYFEAFEQLERLKNIELIRSNSWNVDDLIELVGSTDATIIFIDPLANNETLNILDLRELAGKLEPHDWSNKWLVIDGTMVSGGIDVFSMFSAANHPSVLYYESGSKYLQFGLDMQMAGIVVTPKAHMAQLLTSRRNTGGVMYPSAVNKLPEYDRSMYLSRMHLLSNNAELFASTLQAQNYLKSRINLAYPLKWRELRWDHGGGVVSISMKRSDLNSRACLEQYIDMLLQHCREACVPMTKGVSYGFSTTRVSATAMADDMPAYLRFSIGEEDPILIQRLINTVVNTLSLYLSDYDS